MVPLFFFQTGGRYHSLVLFQAQEVSIASSVLFFLRYAYLAVSIVPWYPRSTRVQICLGDNLNVRLVWPQHLHRQPGYRLRHWSLQVTNLTYCFHTMVHLWLVLHHASLAVALLACVWTTCTVSSQRSPSEARPDYGAWR